MRRELKCGTIDDIARFAIATHRGCDGEGNFVVVWTSFADDPDPDTNPLTNDIGKMPTVSSTQDGYMEFTFRRDPASIDRSASLAVFFGESLT